MNSILQPSNHITKSPKKITVRSQTILVLAASLKI